MKCSNERSSCLSRCLKFGLLALLGIAAVTWLVMLLWNCLLPELFAGVSPIGYWQALGLLLLSRILFGGWRGGCPSRWREQRLAREGMSPEERQQFKNSFRARWSQCCSSDKNSTAGASGEARESAADKPAGTP